MYGIPILKIRRNMGIPILVSRHLYIETPVGLHYLVNLLINMGFTWEFVSNPESSCVLKVR